MAHVVNLSQLVPEDVVLDLGNGVRHTIAGGTPVVVVMELSRLQAQIVENQQALVALAGADEPDLAATETVGLKQVELVTELDARMLDLFRVRQPGLEATGLTAEQLGQVLGGILSGFSDLAGDDPPTKPNRATTRKRSPQTATPRSKRSNGSARS